MFNKSNLEYISIFSVMIVLFLSLVSANVISYAGGIDNQSYSTNNTYYTNGAISTEVILKSSTLFLYVGEEFPLSANVIKYDSSYLEELDVPVPMIYPPVYVFKAKKAGNTNVFIKIFNIDGSTTINKVYINIQPK